MNGHGHGFAQLARMRCDTLSFFLEPERSGCCVTFPKRSTDSFIGFLRGYWDYYRELENDFMTTRKYVSLNQDNFSTYSIEYLKLYQAVCSEIDVIGKDMANAANERFKPDDKQNNILKWWFEIQTKYRISESPSSSVEQYEAGIELPVFSCLFLGRFDCFLLVDLLHKC